MTAAERARGVLRALGATPTSPSSYALLAALGATLVAKTMSVARSEPPEGVLLEAAGACAADLVVYPALAVLIAAGERVRPWLMYLTTPITVLGVVLAVINAAYLAIANDQIDARVIDVGMNRLDEVADIAMLEAISRAGAVGPGLLVGLPVIFFAIRYAWRRAGIEAAELGRLRVQGLLGVLALGVLVLGVMRMAGRPLTLAAGLIEDNALIHTYVTWLEAALETPPEYADAVEGHFGAPLVEPAALATLAKSEQRPNVLLFVLESTRFDHVELPMEGHVSQVPTPNLRALAERGAFYTDVQAALPHTSKSLVSILCGRLPAMENPVIESAHGITRYCLPSHLRAAGYRTAFFQSAIGSFELRPRLTAELGYETFGAFENLEVAPLGYLSGDDRALPGALQAWLSELPAEQPFFATLLTSGTHHPYEPPRDRVQGEPSDARARYAAMVALEDEVVGDTLALLERLGRLDDTIVVALADHGEGLPGDPVLQHDNNFFATGLHVPLILAGPGVAPGRRDGLHSLLDVTPTLLATLGLSSALPEDELRYGLEPAHTRQVAPFACWNDGMCEGFVTETSKVVHLIADHEKIAFDRGDVRGEARAHRPSEQELETLGRVHQALLHTQLSRAPNLMAQPIRLPSGFVCGPGASPCAHPSRPRGGFH